MGAARGRPAVAACTLCSGVGGRRRRLAGPGGQRPDGPLGRLGRKLKEISFSNKNWIFEYTKALEICRRRFRRNFDMGIFPKFF
jgi:hypothetical protein